jgi:AAA+ ATPase superfamily predicted ATPase
MAPKAQGRNPFNFGDLALDEAFTDREAELRELKADIRNGQNLVIFAPRRYGKSSLVWRAAQELVDADEALVAQVDLMRTATREQLAAKLAQAIHEQIATPLFRAREKAGNVFRSLRIAPVMTVDPNTGSLGFSFRAGHTSEDIDATLERLLELPAELAAERNKPVALVFDEFQEVVDIDPHLPPLMRAVFQSQPEVAHIYLGSKRSMMAEIFNDANEPFWRSARQMELGAIPRAAFAGFIRERFEATGRSVQPEVIERVLKITGGHPYGTQEIAYALWEETPPGATADDAAFERSLDRVLRSENAHFTLVWDDASRTQRLVLQALALEPPESVNAEDYRRRHGLPGSSSLQRALDTLVDDELVTKLRPGSYRISEPFLAEWIAVHGA